MIVTGAVNMQFALCSSVNSDVEGYQQLVDLYYRAKQYSNITIHFSFDHINWFDANLCSVLGAILYLLKKENNLSFIVTRDEFLSKFEVLHRNGFFRVDGNCASDNRQTTLPFTQFSKNDKDGYIKYIDECIMNHKRMPELTESLRVKIKDDLIELMTNINFHSGTEDPFFICGQHYPRNGCLKLTITDVGIGFLPKFNEVTKGIVTTDVEAITWALKGKTTKQGVPGGLGIKNMHTYFNNFGGSFNIVTGKAFWSSGHEKSLESGFLLLSEHLPGSTINLYFKH